MNKGEFAAVIADRTELSKAAAGRAVDGILDTLTEAMAEHDVVTFAGWGNFSAQRRKGRDSHDPRNPQRTIHIPPAYVPKFKPGSTFKREIQAAFAAQPHPDPGGSGQAPTPGPPEPHEATGGVRPVAESRSWNDDARGSDRPPSRWRPLAQRSSSR